jgi:hypothetical protein
MVPRPPLISQEPFKLSYSQEPSEVISLYNDHLKLIGRRASMSWQGFQIIGSARQTLSPGLSDCLLVPDILAGLPKPSANAERLFFGVVFWLGTPDNGLRVPGIRGCFDSAQYW